MRRRRGKVRRAKVGALTGRVKSISLSVHHGGRRRRARGIRRLRQAVRLLREAGASWWPAEPGWPTSPLRDADVQAIVMSLMREADRRWHRDGWSSYRMARALDVMYDTIKSVPVPRRVLEGLASIGLARLAALHGIVRGDDR